MDADQEKQKLAKVVSHVKVSTQTVQLHLFPKVFLVTKHRKNLRSTR